jgi:hypothetical protein
LERLGVALSGRRRHENAAWREARRGVAGTDPRLGFAAAILAGALGWFVATRMLPADAVMPAVSTLLLVLAALFAALAWWRGRMNAGEVSFADVAGALTLIGLFAAATIEPEQLVRLVGRDDAQ